MVGSTQVTTAYPLVCGIVISGLFEAKFELVLSEKFCHLWNARCLLLHFIQLVHVASLEGSFCCFAVLPTEHTEGVKLAALMGDGKVASCDNIKELQ